MMIAVRPVTQYERFVACLTLRYRVYSHLGYLKHQRATDLDEFDWTSLHFEAVDQQNALVGVVRLVVPGGTAGKIDSMHCVRAWCDRLNKSQRFTIRPSGSIPIQDTMRANRVPPEILPSHSLCELSRIIVAPESRGRGVAKLLADAVAERAAANGFDAILLQCLPDHVHFFQRLGYEVVFDSLDYTHLSVPEQVVAMSRSLAD